LPGGARLLPAQDIERAVAEFEASSEDERLAARAAGQDAGVRYAEAFRKVVLA